MTKNAYPNTTHQPLQALDFRLANNKRVRTLLKPMPDSTRTQVAHVDLDHTNAGCTLLYQVSAQGTIRSVIQAGALAYQIAQHETQQAGNIKIVEVLLEGEEFLEKADMEQITGNTIPVTVV